MAQDVTDTKANKRRGLLLASLVIPVGAVAWVILWQWGFIASVVSFGMAFGAVWLYQKGAHEKAGRDVAVWLLGIILIGVIVAFLSGMASDAWYAYTTDLKGTQGFFSADFWDMFISNLLTVDLWSQYVTDLLISVVFAALGAGGVIRDLFKQGVAQTPKSA